MAASANMFYIAIDYKNETNIKVAFSNINTKIHPLFSKQQTLGVRLTTVQWKIPVDLTGNCF